MPPVTMQAISIILPDVSTQPYILGTETETIDDLVEHTSVEFPVEFKQEKQVHITATEVVPGLRATGAIVGGPFTIGEGVVAAPSGAVGVVVAQGATWIDILYVSGTFAATDTIAGAVSGAIINGALVLTVAVPGNLWCWIELSPVPSANSNYWAFPLPTSTVYWAAIGGGGGAIIPTAPYVEVSGLAGLPGTLVHTILLPWEIHSPWARLVVQTPIAAGLPNAYWVIQAMFSAKTP